MLEASLLTEKILFRGDKEFRLAFESFDLVLENLVGCVLICLDLKLLELLCGFLSSGRDITEFSKIEGLENLLKGLIPLK